MNDLLVPFELDEKGTNLGLMQWFYKNKKKG